jgi:hypothetical protein
MRTYSDRTFHLNTVTLLAIPSGGRRSSPTDQYGPRAVSFLFVEVAEAFDLMWRDVVELATLDWVGRTALALFVLLPVTSLTVALRGNRRAWIPLGITLTLVTVWFLYYATTWWQPVGAATAFMIGTVAVATGWLILASQLLNARREAQPSQPMTRDQ